MLKTILKQNYKKFSDNKYIVKFGTLVSAENLWHFNRESIARGIAVGVGCGWIPLPLHTIIAVFLAILLDCNIPLVAVAIWVANPITMPFMYYFAFRVGERILGTYATNVHLHLDVRDIMQAIQEIWQPFLLGCLVCGLATGVLAYLIIHLLWPTINGKFSSKL